MLREGTMLPDLPAPYDAALRACLEEMFGRYDVVAVVASGTVVRGAPDRRSDLDLYVLHRGTFRERLQLFFAGVPCEIFVNPPSRIPRYFEEDKKQRRPCSAHMFATGVIVYDPEGVATALVEEAKSALADTPPVPDGNALAMSRYESATMFEDAEDLVERDPEGALLLLGYAVYQLARCRLAAEPDWIPRHKDFLADLRKLDPEAAQWVVAAGTGDLPARLEAAKRLCMHVTGADGFFEWASPREEV